MDNKLDKVENINERKTTFGEKFSLKVRKSFIIDKSKTFLLVIIIILAFIAINMWAQKQDLAQIDITQSKIYTLTQSSKDAIKDIQDEVNIYVYGYDENSPYVNFIKQYVACNPNIKYEVVSEATNYDVVTTYNMGTYNEILVVANGKDVSMYPDYEFQSSEYVNGVAQDVDLTEQSITNAIVKVTDKEPTKVYFVAGHGEFNDTEIASLLKKLDDSIYEYDFLNLLSAISIPEDCDILTILAPSQDYTTSEADVIKNYINNGGNVLVAMTTVDQTTDFVNLQSILDLYAVSIEDGILYEGNANNCMSVQGKSVPIVLLPNYSSATKITSELKNPVVFPIAQSISVDYDKVEEMNVSPQELIFTSTKTYKVSDYENGFNLEGVEPDVYVVGRKITKTIGEENKSSKLIIIGNDTFLADYDGIIGEYPIGYSGNEEFIMNCFADLSEKQNTLKISKNIELKTFTPTAQQSNIVQFIVYSIPVLIILAGIIIGVIRKRMR